MLGEHERDALHAEAEWVTYARREQLCNEGEAAEFAIVIQEGWVKISYASARETNTLVLRGPADIVGESASADQPRIATVTALTEVRGLSVTSDQFIGFLRRYPGALRALQRTYSDRLVESDRMRMAVGQMNGARRLARCLLQLADYFGHTEDHGSKITIDGLSQEEFGQLISASPITVVRALKNWRLRGIVGTGPQLKIELLDLPTLRQIAGNDR